MRRLFLLLAAVVIGALLLPAVPAGAAGPVCHREAVKNPDGSITYHVVCETHNPGEPGTPGGGGPAEDCGQDQVTPGPGDGPYFCTGGVPCAYTTNVVPLAIPTTEPEPGKKWQVLICSSGGTFTKNWVQTGGAQPRPLIVQAQEAYGNIDVPDGLVGHSPTARGIVLLPTWLWLEPGSFGRRTGESAEGLVAVAMPDSTHWNTGDGGSVDCAGGGVPQAAACTHTYTRASARYDGNVTRTWRVHYEQNGAQINIPGAPVALTADTAWALSVAEAQVLTGGGR